MGWDAIAPAAVVLALLGVVWGLTNKRIDEKASSTKLEDHIKSWENSQSKIDADIRQIRDQHDKALMDMNSRHDNNLRELRQEINGMSNRFDDRFAQIISLLTSRTTG